MYWDEVGHHMGPERLAEFWMAHPRARAAINARVSGDQHTWPMDWFRAGFSGSLPFANALSIGAGMGELERDLLRKGVASFVTGIDVVEEPLRLAAETAMREGLDSKLAYVRADAREYLARHASAFDAIFFHGALHHFDRIDSLMELVRSALVPGGWLYLDEYVGPSMRQWTARRLLLSNVVYYLLPSGARRPRIVRAPVNPEDPTEMIESHAIVPAVRKHFEIVEKRDYGGNLLGVIYANLRRDDPETLDRAVARILRWEELLLRVAPSHFAVIVARAAGSNARRLTT
jgi:SAM-dependent methyltransferase